MKPLNGEKTHPLSRHAQDVLGRLEAGPLPRQEINPGVANRLLRGELVEEVMLPSPYKTHCGRDIPHLRITGAGKPAR